MKEIMLDLETLSTQPNASILSMAAVDVDNLDNYFFSAVSDPNGAVDIDTIRWWLDQDKEAQVYLQTPKPLVEVLLTFITWAQNIIKDNDYTLWGNGADFDNVILRQAFKRVNITPFWPRRNNRCFRTIKNLFPQVPEPEFIGIKHNPVDDAKHQARWLNKIKKYIEIGNSAIDDMCLTEKFPELLS